MPRGARACDKARVRRYLGLQDSATKSGKDVALSDKEFSAHLVGQNLRDMVALMAWIQGRAPNAKGAPMDERLLAIGMEAYMYKHQGDIASRMAFAWDMHDAPAKLASARRLLWEDVVAAATLGQWT